MNDMKVSKNVARQDLYIQRRNIIESYLEAKIKEDYDLGLNTSYFKMNADWLEDPAIFYDENKGYMVKVEELLKFAESRKLVVRYLRENEGICTKERANGILLFF